MLNFTKSITLCINEIKSPTEWYKNGGSLAYHPEGFGTNPKSF